MVVGDAFSAQKGYSRWNPKAKLKIERDVTRLAKWLPLVSGLLKFNTDGVGGRDGGQSSCWSVPRFERYYSGQFRQRLNGWRLSDREKKKRTGERLSLICAVKLIRWLWWRVITTYHSCATWWELSRSHGPSILGLKISDSGWANLKVSI